MVNGVLVLPLATHPRIAAVMFELLKYLDVVASAGI